MVRTSNLFLLFGVAAAAVSAQITPTGNCPVRSEAYCCAEVHPYEDPVAVRRLQPVNLTPKRATRKHGGKLGYKCKRPFDGQCPVTHPHPVCCKDKDFQGFTFLGCRSVSEAVAEASQDPKRVAEEAQQRGERAMKKNEKTEAEEAAPNSGIKIESGTSDPNSARVAAAKKALKGYKGKPRAEERRKGLGAAGNKAGKKQAPKAAKTDLKTGKKVLPKVAKAEIQNEPACTSVRATRAV